MRYAALITTLADHASARTVIGNIALSLPPLVLLAVLATRRRAWRGNQARVLGVPTDLGCCFRLTGPGAGFAAPAPGH